MSNLGQVRVVWVFRKSQWVALVTTDLTLSVAQIIEFYGARWKIEIDQPFCLHNRVLVLIKHLSDLLRPGARGLAQLAQARQLRVVGLDQPECAGGSEDRSRVQLALAQPGIERGLGNVECWASR
jgi:hypothetical protein